MTQATIGTIDPTDTSGTELAALLSNWKDALHSLHKGATAPSYRQAGIGWIDDSADPTWKLKIYTGSAWIEVLRLNVSTGKALLPVELGGTGADTAATARTNLGLGSLALQSKVQLGNFDPESVVNADVKQRTLTINRFANTTPNIVFGTDASGIAVELETSKEIPPHQRCVSLMSGTGEYVSAFVMQDGSVRVCGLENNYRNGDPGSNVRWVPLPLFTDHDGELPIKFTKVAVGYASGYALDEDGYVWSWGFNDQGQLGHGDTVSRAVAERIPFFFDNTITVSEIICPTEGNTALTAVWFLTTDGDVYACGDNTFGYLGTGDNLDRDVPTQCGTISDIVEVSVSGQPYHVMARESSGAFWVWGRNTRGQLGLGDTTDRNTPVENLLLVGVKQVLATSCEKTDLADEGGSSFVIDGNDELWATGYNLYGQLGLGDTTQRTAFTKVTAITETVEGVFAFGGRYATVFAKVDDVGSKEVYSWGYGGFGAHGQGDLLNKATPAKPTGDFQGAVEYLRGGGSLTNHGVILKAGNKLWGAGWNLNGNLGVGDQASKSTFTKVLGVSGTIAEVHCTGRFNVHSTFVRYTDGRVDAAGANNVGQLGLGETNITESWALQRVKF